MDFETINYEELNSRQQEIYNFQKVAALLAEYGFNCIKLKDDWHGADFIADHIDGETTHKVQLKSRITIKKKYHDTLYMAFPINEDWYFIQHHKLEKLAGEHTPWLDSNSWNKKEYYHSVSVNSDLREALEDYKLDPKTNN